MANSTSNHVASTDICIVPFAQPRTSTPYEAYGCEVNAIDVDTLFQKYAAAGFLYPAKLARLKPYMDEIIANWKKGIQAGDRLHKIVSYRDEANDAWASLSTWRTTNHGWSTQHLVSTGNPIGSRAVMLSEQLAELNDEYHGSNQNWFRPDNRMPKRIFGSIESSLGEHNAKVDCFNLLEVTPLNASQKQGNLTVIEVDEWSQPELFELARETRGAVYAEAEELDGCDFNLSQLDEEYQSVGLRRYRRAWLALTNDSARPVGALIAYRGPLGFNFSFLDNRADLLISPSVHDDDLDGVINQLIAAASEAYDDFAPGYIPMIADDASARVLQLRGDRIVRQYCQSIWMRDGYQDWFDHTNSFYQRIVERLERRARRAG